MCFILVTFSFIYIYVNMKICVYVFSYVITLASLVCVVRKKRQPDLYSDWQQPLDPRTAEYVRRTHPPFLGYHVFLRRPAAC